MEAWQILLIIIAVVVFVYLSAAFIIFTHIFEFTGKLRRRLDALNIILFEKRALLLKVHDLACDAGSVFSEEDEKHFAELEAISFAKPVFETCKNAISLQKSIQNRLSYELTNTPSLKKMPEMTSIFDMISDLDKNIRTSSSLYNADVLAFNYWINVPGFRWICIILGKKQRSYIN